MTHWVTEGETIVEEYQTLISTLSLTMGVAWASGLNLYAAILMLGLGGATGSVVLPEDLQIVQEPMVILAAGLMYAVEFFADKIPGVDTGWDAIHTFVRIPAGALLAASTVGDVGPGMELAAALVGGSVTGVTHAAKASTRVMINTSPEPVTNWTASITEDLAVFGGLWAALNHPVLFLIAFIIFIILLIWLLPKLWRGIIRVFRKIGQWLGLVKPAEPAENVAQANTSQPSTSQVVAEQAAPENAADAILEKLQKLEAMHRSGSLSDEEFALAKAGVLKQGV
ncbi:DUF4126 domain-containing protein [Spongiibacter sp. KMU-158]|uniref:DUF4126 domain-containing protein n=1 Tax=Spongiibacter pelagi TaxID=2760804 RepID=A0A927BZM0_9GAMM|nr:DUF4126 domain-containing protein [Spongiibacter pelagi]MBD2857468.1 DUF4126 domain-containing protein [Spongiibacter pelagi]